MILPIPMNAFRSGFCSGRLLRRARSEGAFQMLTVIPKPEMSPVILSAAKDLNRKSTTVAASTSVFRLLVHVELKTSN